MLVSARGRKPDAATAGQKARRLGLLVTGILFVLLFAGVAIASGIGKPSLPSGAVAVVSDLPDGDYVITQEQFDTALQQMAAQAQMPELPAEDDPQRKEVEGAAFNDLLDIAWITGEAADRGISVTQRQIEDQLDQVAQQNFQCDADVEPFECEELADFLEESHYTEEDVLDRIEVGLLSNELQTAITEDAPEPTEAQMRAYYETFQSQFVQPESADLRLIQTEERPQAARAKAALEEDSSTESWEQVAERFSTDSISSESGGLREGVTAGMFEQSVQAEMDEAPLGELIGPIEGDAGFFVFQVEERHEEHTRPFEDDDVQQQLEQQIAQQLAASTQTAFIDNYRNVWTARTVCADSVMTDRCVNNPNGENVFLTDQAREQLEEATEGQAPALKNRTVWPKPPNTLTLPIDAVSINGTQIICYLEEQEETGFPLTGTAPPQRPHPPGPTEAINAPPEGQEDIQMPPTCGAMNPTAFGGGMPIG